MTTLQQIDLECPVCAARFRSQTVVSTNGFGGKRTDFHERAAGTQPLPYLVHTCRRCGYTAGAKDFEQEVDSLTKAHVFDELAPAVAEHALTGSEKYELAVKTAKLLGQDHRHLADYWLRAAWCCVDEGDTEAERFYRLRAVEEFTAALEAYDGVDAEERAVLTYLVGELWRRIGNLAEANEWFNRVRDAVTDTTTQQWIIDAAKQQRDCPREWFG